MADSPYKYIHDRGSTVLDPMSRKGLITVSYCIADVLAAIHIN